ncbi:MAG: hypothetical protein QM770_19840 [Tepidisphaeraceae bacterium]
MKTASLIRWTLCAALPLASFAALSTAQPAGPDGGPPGMRGGDGGLGHDGPGREGMGPDGMGPRRFGMREPNQQRLELIRGFQSIVDGFCEIGADPAKSAVAAVMSAGDVLRAKGPAEAINYFEKLLPEVNNPTVERAIRLQLIDLYRASNQSDKALEHATKLIKAANVTTSTTAPSTGF